jgi:hypothetical protein
MNIAHIILLFYWGPILIYLIIYSIRIRNYVKKRNIKSLDSIQPSTYRYGELTDFQKIGEAGFYMGAIFLGPFILCSLPKNMIKDNILPDS